MAQRIRRAVAGTFLVAAVVAAILVPLRGITPLPGLVFLTVFLVATAAKPEPGSRSEIGTGHGEPTTEPGRGGRTA